MVGIFRMKRKFDTLKWKTLKIKGIHKMLINSRVSEVYPFYFLFFCELWSIEIKFTYHMPIKVIFVENNFE